MRACPFLYVAILITILFSSVQAEEVPTKTLAIVYEDGKTPDALLDSALGYFSQLIDTGALRSAKLGSASVFGKVIDIQTPTDSLGISKREINTALSLVKNSMQSANIPYSAQFTVLKTNLLFGDKSLAYVLNPYKGCYDHSYLAKGLEKTGFKIVDKSENPDITMTIGVDLCMSENEFKAYAQKNTQLRLHNARQSDQNISSHQTIGNDLVQSGANVQLNSPSGKGNAGLAVAGVGLALNMVDWLITQTPQERDFIRYYVKFEGKDKKTVEFYPLTVTKETHKVGTPILSSAKNQTEQILFTLFLGWNLDSNDFSAKLPPVMMEKDLFKSIEMMIASSNKNAVKDIQQ